MICHLYRCHRNFDDLPAPMLGPARKGTPAIGAMGGGMVADLGRLFPLAHEGLAALLALLLLLFAPDTGTDLRRTLARTNGGGVPGPDLASRAAMRSCKGRIRSISSSLVNCSRAERSSIQIDPTRDANLNLIFYINPELLRGRAPAIPSSAGRACSRSHGRSGDTGGCRCLPRSCGAGGAHRRPKP